MAEYEPMAGHEVSYGHPVCERRLEVETLMTPTDTRSEGP